LNKSFTATPIESEQKIDEPFRKFFFIQQESYTILRKRNLVLCYIYILISLSGRLKAVFCFIAAPASEEGPTLTIDTGENQQEEGEEEEEEETVESAPVSGRGQRGVPRRAARRARGRRGGATRARVVSTRLHGGRRNAILPSTIDNEDNNATLEETVNTETEESPKKSTTTTKTPVVEQKPIASAPTTPAGETSSPSQINSGSNVRVSGK